MAGKKKRKIERRDIRADNLTTLAEQRYPVDYSLSFTPSHHKQARQRQLAAHTLYPGTTAPPPITTLATRLHALPPELRLQIFSHLLVQPVKWNLSHTKDCEYTTTPPHLLAPRVTSLLPSIHDTDPDHPVWPHALHNSNTCVRCLPGHHHQRLPLWRRDDPTLHVWRNPWRSEWAPDVGNPFVCSDCWDAKLRWAPHPRPLELLACGRMRCLCARRRHLAVLLVCRRWYEEGATVFYTSNTFAFETVRTFVDFAANLPARWRRLISKISIRFYNPDTLTQGLNTNDRIARIFPTVESRAALKPLWHALRSLPALSSLELDALMLARPDAIDRLLRLGLRNLRSLRFTLRNRLGWSFDPPGGKDGRTLPAIYHEFMAPRILVGGCAEAVARAVRGERQAWLKKQGALERVTERERVNLTAMLWPVGGETPGRGEEGVRKKNKGKPATQILVDGARRVWYDEDVEEWEKIWRCAGVRSYLPGGWPERRKCGVEGEEVEREEGGRGEDDDDDDEDETGREEGGGGGGERATAVNVITTPHSDDDVASLLWLHDFSNFMEFMEEEERESLASLARAIEVEEVRMREILLDEVVNVPQPFLYFE